jgi:hypothetical protein
VDYSYQAVAVARVCQQQQRLLAGLLPRHSHRTCPLRWAVQQARQVWRAALGRRALTYSTGASCLAAVVAGVQDSQQLQLRQRATAATAAMAAVAAVEAAL